MVGNDGAIEIKCPQPKAYAKIVIDNEVPGEYKPQLAQTFLVCPEVQWIDFIAFNEKFKSKPMVIIRVTREDFNKEIEKLEKAYTTYETKLTENLKHF
jgi:exodeoxyribonuclease (lambda-induced)